MALIKVHELAGVPIVVTDPKGTIYLRVSYLTAGRKVRTQDFGPLSVNGTTQLSNRLTFAGSAQSRSLPSKAQEECNKSHDGHDFGPRGDWLRCRKCNAPKGAS